MIITSAEYIKSFPSISNFDIPELPAIAFVGRSNVGKSSLINHLLNRRKLVKTSSSPGKTQLLNFFLINSSFYFVDLPGYGFANVPVRVKAGWLSMMQDFLCQYPNLKLVVQLLDIRHLPTQDDLEFNQLLSVNDCETLVVANKSDKVNKSGIKKSLAEIMSRLNLNTPPLLHSSLKKTGREAIWRMIDDHLKSGC
ncbi:ribosome biogenesis GTP-binding protein YihA/YsxC [bacterium]|nr:ribosome biogenesis GTP-binding protein YihA/YsxC [bacterium]